MKSIGGNPQIAGRLAQALGRLFTARQIHLRAEGRVTFLQVSRRTQIVLVTLIALLFGWSTFTTINYGLRDKVLAAKNMRLANAHLAYQSLLQQVAGYQKRFEAVARDLEENHSLMLGLVEHNTALQKDLKGTEGELRSSRLTQKSILNQSENLKSSLHDLTNNVQNLTAKNFTLQGDLNETESGLSIAIQARDYAVAERERMALQAAGLEDSLRSIEQNQGDSIQRLTKQTIASIEGVERVVGFTGLNVEHLLGAKNSRQSARGGPFVEAKSDQLPGGRLKAKLTNLEIQLERWSSLRNLMARMPLATPLNYFQLTSRFGKRRDPVNKRWAMHYGLDFGGVYKSAVYATAPGVVTHVGWKRNYGKLIEINHRDGLKTRYGHLKKIFVKKGEKVKFRGKIALLGNTGRSTGPHLHYEILFRGRPVDPMKFIKAGRYVFKD
jgi:murein DD-endopeptidase MepM/ murein hydrolase activator NlpD